MYDNITSEKVKYVFFREKNAHNLSAFKDELGKINWAEMPGLNDPSCAYELFVGKYTTIYDKCFPLRKMKAKRFNLRKPWFTKGLAKSIRKKNKLYQSFLNNPNSSNEKAYKSYKNKLTHSLRVAKRLYYEKQLEKLTSNVKATWKVPNEILNRIKGKRGLPSIFRADSREISNPNEIANLFCKHWPQFSQQNSCIRKVSLFFFTPKTSQFNISGCCK